MRSPLLAAFALVVATLPACTALSFTDEDGPDGTAEAAACGPVFDAYIAYADRCGVYARDLVLGVSQPDPDARGYFQATCAAMAKRPGNGRTVAAWKRCEEALRKGDCADISEVWYACKEVPGTQKNGEPCASNDECASGSCSAKSDAKGGDLVVACGVCQPMGVAGDTCGDRLPQCGRNLHCNHIEGMCVELHSRGQDEPCSWPSECAEGLVCDYNPYAVGREHSFCKRGRDTDSPISAAGDRCSDSAKCSHGLTCEDGACVVNRVDAGAVCGTALCPAGYSCAATKGGDDKRCRPPAGLGESCSTRPCAAFLTCSNTSSKCELPVPRCHE